MSKALFVELITPQKEQYAQEADYVEAPGGSGSLGILPNHTNLLSTLESGELKISNPHKVYYFAIGQGFLQIRNNHVIILANQAYRPDDVNIQSAMNEEKRLEEELSFVKDISSRNNILSSLKMTKAMIAIAKREQPTE